MTHDTVLARVRDLLLEVVGEDSLHHADVTMTTSFSSDLGLESIEFVALAEALRAEYGARVDFAAWLADMELKEILDLRVGQLVEFICQCLSQRATA